MAKAKNDKPVKASKPAIISQATPQQAAAKKVVSEVAGLVASAKLLELTAGLFSIGIGGSKSMDAQRGFNLPATLVSGIPVTSEGARIEMFPGRADSHWLGPDGGTVVVSVPPSGGRILITTYRPAGQEAVPLAIQIAKLGRPQGPPPPAPAPTGTPPGPSAAAPEPTGKSVKAEVVLLLEREGERRFTGEEWGGTPGGKQRIDAFAIRPGETIDPAGVEYKAFGPNGRETPWVSDAKLCGGKRGGPGLTGFAVRLRAPFDQKFEAIYQGSFFESGASERRRNGEACYGARADEPLEALSIRLVER